jgi:predicted Zn-dependent protease
VTLFQTNIVNAMAMPGGQLLAFPGLWDRKAGLVKDTDELAAVFGHEIAHVVCRHSTEQLTRELPVQLILGGAAVYAELKEDEDMSEIVTGAFVLYQGLLVPRYSRKDETEADLVGMLYMARAGFDPRAAVRLWRRMDETRGGEWPVLSIFSTHPAHKRRFEDLEKALPAAIAEYEKAKADYPAMPVSMAPDRWRPRSDR